jgi:hypothetical protein
MINILIDQLTNSIRHRETGAEFETILVKAYQDKKCTLILKGH